MIQALLYKEWVKTRRVVSLIGIVFAAAIIYTMINTGQLFRVGGAVQTWSTIILKDMPLLPSFFQWIPVLSGILLGVAQFAPEMQDKRLKLTLHLPLPEPKIVTTLLLYGAGGLLILYVLVYAILSLSLSFYYPFELLVAMFWSSLPHFLAGLFGYLLVSWICVEPVWRYRIGYAFASVAFLSFLFIGSLSGAYKPFTPTLIVLLFVCFTFPFYSMARFKDGAQ